MRFIRCAVTKQRWLQIKKELILILKLFPGVLRGHCSGRILKCIKIKKIKIFDKYLFLKDI